jgi:hypothetical protein
LVKEPERGHLVEFFRRRFGISEAIFSNYYLCKRGRTVWLVSKDERLRDLASLRVKSIGMPLLRRVGPHLKPTSVALAQLRDLIERKEIKIEFAGNPGYVMVVSTSLIIGCALYLPGRLISQFPRHMFTSQTWEYVLQERNDEVRID